MFSLLRNGSQKAGAMILQNLMLNIVRTKMDFAGKNVLITGASSGIGWEVCKILVQKKVCNLAILDIIMQKDELKKLADDNPDTNIIFCKTDVTEKDEIKQSVSRMVSEKFSGCLDVTINCAGIIQDQDPELTMKVNLLGVIYTTLAAMCYMDKSKGGKGGLIANVASVLGLEPSGPIAVYTASKHGIIGWTRSMAEPIHFERNCIAHTAICPGVTETPLVTKLKGRTTFDYALEEAEAFLANGQKPELCAVNMVKAMEENKNGSIWICDKGKLQEVKPTKYWSSK